MGRMVAVVDRSTISWRDRIRYHVPRAMRAALNRNDERDAVLRAWVFDLAAKFSPLIGVERDGMRYVVSTQDRGVGRDTFIAGEFDAAVMAEVIEIAEQAVGRQPLLAGRTFIDIGANIGTTTIPALLRFGARDAIAFEPVPENVRLLRCNVIANAVDDRVRVMPMALSDTTGAAGVALSADNWGDHRVKAGSTTGDLTVPLARFDDVAAALGVDLRDVGLVWIDTQGHEGHVLRGASSLLDSDVPVCIEYWPFGLREAGGFDLLHELVASSYRTVIDARAAGGPASLPATELATFAPRYPGPADFTDLVLLK